MKKNRNKTGKIFLLVFLVTLLIGFTVILVLLLKNNEQEEKEESKNTIVEYIEKQLPKEENEEIENKVDYSGLSAEEIVAKATDNVENFTYSLYCKIDADWALEISDEDKATLYAMGGNEEGLNFSEIALVSGKIKKDLEYFNYLETIYELGATTLNSTQLYFDYPNNRTYSLYTNSQTIDSDSLEWKEEENTENNQIIFKDYLRDLEIQDVTEDENSYKVQCYLQIDNQISNNLNWLYYNLCAVADYDVSTRIPVELEISKVTGYLSKIVYDLSCFNELSIGEMYKITNIEMYYSFVDINETDFEIPEDLKKN